MRLQTHGCPAALAALLLAGCNAVDEGYEAAARNASGFDEACAVIHGNTGELMRGGELVQLDVELLAIGRRSTQQRAGDSGIDVEAASRVEARSSQLACVSRGGESHRWQFSPSEHREMPPFPVVSSGAAYMHATTEIRTDDSAGIETGRVDGSVERLQVLSISGHAPTESHRACVRIRFTAPLTGQATRSGSSRGQHFESSMPPSDLVGTQYSLLKVERRAGDTYAFRNNDFSICTGAGSTHDSAPGELVIDEARSDWRRDGPWLHMAGPVEERELRFRMRIVPRTLPYPDH